MNQTQENRAAPLGQLLLQAFRWFDQSLLASLAARGVPKLSQAQSMLFANLDIEGGTRLSELARRIGVTRQAIHKTVQELRSVDLVELAADPTNRSAKLVRLTPAGSRTVAIALSVFVDLEAQLGSRLSAENVLALRKTLENDWGEHIIARARTNT